MLALLKEVASLVAKFPELIPLLRTLVQTIAGPGSKDEKLNRVRRATIAAGMRTAFDEALRGK
jgi:hypothetical protein